MRYCECGEQGQAYTAGEVVAAVEAALAVCAQQPGLEAVAACIRRLRATLASLSAAGVKESKKLILCTRLLGAVAAGCPGGVVRLKQASVEALPPGQLAIRNTGLLVEAAWVVERLPRIVVAGTVPRQC
jgi:hypothetical protein